MRKKRNSLFSKGLVFLTAFVCLAGMFPISARAEDAYTYKIRLLSGAQGSINNEGQVAWEGLSYGDTVSFRQNTVTISRGGSRETHNISIAVSDDSKYYVKGIRKSGRDNNVAEEVAKSFFTVTEDADYVIAYGMKGESVAYTVKFQDSSGKELAPDETYYGNVGDRPVIAHLYIEGYQPQAYNLTGTLKANAADNVFTFVYSCVEAEAGGTTTTTTTTTTTNTTTTITGGNTATGGAGGGGNTAQENQGEEEEAGEEPGGESLPATPFDLVDIDNPSVPLAGNTGGGEEAEGSSVDSKDFAVLMGMMAMPTAARFGVCSLVILLVSLGAYFLFFRRKEEREEDVYEWHG